MKCEHGKEISFVIQMMGNYLEDGVFGDIEGCDVCSENCKIIERTVDGIDL